MEWQSTLSDKQLVEQALASAEHAIRSQNTGLSRLTTHRKQTRSIENNLSVKELNSRFNGKEVPVEHITYKRSFGWAPDEGEPLSPNFFGTGANPHCEPCKDPRSEEKKSRKQETRHSSPYSNIQETEIACIGQGSRTEIAAACEAIRQGARMEDVAAQHSETYVKYHRGLVQLHAILQPKQCFKSLVLWLYGEAGSGKSRCARQVARGAQDNGWTYYSKAGSTKWFDGYSGNECMIWDELTDEFPFTLLLQIPDCYELQVKTKGGYVNFNPKL